MFQENYFKLSDGNYIKVNLILDKIQNFQIKDIDSIILIYDVTKRNTFESCSFYLNYSKDFKKDIKVILLGNKSDDEEYRQVTKEKGKEFALSNNLIFMEISCAQNKNVSKAFEVAIGLALETNKIYNLEIDKVNNEINNNWQIIEIDKVPKITEKIFGNKKSEKINKKINIDSKNKYI